MNKKAVVIHWILFGVLLALAIFFLSSNLDEVPQKVNGEWQVTFLTENYLEAQKFLLKLDVIAKNVGLRIALGLAENGGFEEGKDSACGKIEKVNLWNKKDQWCVPNIKETFTSLAHQKISQRLPRQTFSDVNYQGTFFYGQGEKRTVRSATGLYTFDASFSVNLGYSFDEYKKVEEEARDLVAKCYQQDSLKTCLDQNKLLKWFYTSCEEEEFEENDRQVVFCVISPNSYIFPANLFVQYPQVSPVRYKLALDFSPLEIS